MTDLLNMEKIRLKEIKTICIVIGAFYAAYGLFSIGILSFQSFFANQIEPGAFEADVLDDLQHSFIHGFSFMPLLVMLGLGYILFGVFLHRLVEQHLKIYLILAILTLLWVATYLLGSYNIFMVNREAMLTGNEFMNIFMKTFKIGNFFIFLMIFIVPLIVMGNKLMQYRKLLRTDEQSIY
jgi:hypothetical protein